MIYALNCISVRGRETTVWFSHPESPHARCRLALENCRQLSMPEIHGGPLLSVVAVAVVHARDVLLFRMIEDSTDRRWPSPETTTPASHRRNSRRALPEAVSDSGCWCRENPPPLQPGGWLAKGNGFQHGDLSKGSRLLPRCYSSPQKGQKWSGWPDSNRRPPDPQSGALTRLRYIPSLKILDSTPISGNELVRLLRFPGENCRKTVPKPRTIIRPVPKRPRTRSRRDSASAAPRVSSATSSASTS